MNRVIGSERCTKGLINRKIIPKKSAGGFCGANSVKRILSVGDVVYSATGKEMKVISMNDEGFETEEDFFFYTEVRKLFFLTSYGYYHSRGTVK